MAYNKYYLQKKQVSYDNGLSWEDVTPIETRQGAYIDTYQTLAECEGDYSTQYLTFESKTNNNTIYWHAASAGFAKTISASTDNGNTWTAYAATTGGTIIATLNDGDKLLLKGENAAYSNSYENHFDSSGQFEAYGNIMSLVSGDTFENATEVASYAFQGLFNYCIGIVSAENLILPATTLASACYNVMFNRCTSLTKAPELPATTLVNNCYRGMFQGCTSLNYIKCLATDISASNCTNNWGYGVSSTGTFVKDASMSSWTTGDSGIPSGWTVQNNS